MAADANANAAPTALAPNVLLAFDDFSRAGKYLLEQLSLEGAEASSVAIAALPEALAPHARVAQYTQQGRLTLSVVTLATAAVGDDAAALWALADALVQWLSASDVDSLRVVASLHLPQAKPHAEALQNVYVATIGDISTSEPAASPLQAFDAAWEISDAFLTRVLHFARVEQAFATQLLVAKGYRPGRDGAGTRDALTALAAALPLVVKGATIDVLRAEDEAIKTLLTQKREPQQHNLLYQ